MGPTRECHELSVEPRGAVECSTLGGRQRGAPVRVVRATVGRVDMRVSCIGPCAVHGISPDSCDGCVAFDQRDEHIEPTFADLHVDHLVELVIKDRATLEVCFDPDYGPPPWGG